jgi:IstB-like ATP binding protein
MKACRCWWFGIRRIQDAKVRAIALSLLPRPRSRCPASEGLDERQARRVAVDFARLPKVALEGRASIALGREAILAGYTVQLMTATTLVAGLAKAHGERRLDKKLLALSKPKLLIIDELGYLPREPDAAHLFFQLISRRYETGAMLITSNRGGDALVAENGHESRGTVRLTTHQFPCGNSRPSSGRFGPKSAAPTAGPGRSTTAARYRRASGRSASSITFSASALP